MSLARSLLRTAIALAWLSAPLAAQSASDPPPQSGAQPAAADLTAPRRSVDESNAAREAGDYATARAKAAEAVTDLLARPAAAQDAAWLTLLELAGFAASAAQDPQTTKRAFQRTYEVRLATCPEDDRLLQQARANLASTMANLGDLAGARALEEKALEVLSRTIPADDRNLQLARMNLALTMKDQGDLVGSNALLEQVLEVFSRTLPDHDPDLQRARTNLAMTKRALGDVEGSRALQEQVLEVLSRTLPDDHPDLQRARMNLAVTLQTLGDLERAKALQELVLEAFTRTLPNDHAELQAARQNLAQTLEALGDLERTRALREQVFEIRSSTLPDDHPNLQSARLHLAASLYTTGDLPGAKALQQKVIEVYSRTLPDDHAMLQAARGNLALTIKDMGDLDGARALEEKVVEVLARTLPDGHSDLETARMNLGGTLFELGDLPGAEALFEKAVEALSRTLPDDHVDLQLARQNLAATRCRLGDLEGARAIQQKALDVLSRKLPDDHPDLQKVRLNLALIVKDLGDLEGARALEEKVVGIFARTLPDDHPYTLAARMNLAGTIRTQGDLPSARALEEWVLETHSRTLSADHPTIQLARHNLALTLSNMGDLEGAKTLQEAVLEVRCRTLPEDHIDVQMARMNLVLTILRQLARSGHAAQNERQDAMERSAALFSSVCRALTHAARTAILGSPTREAEARCAQLAQSLDFPLSFARGFGLFEPSAALEPDLIVLSETTRGAAIASAGLTRRAARSPKYAESRRALRTATEELAALAQGGTTSEEFYRARMNRESIERELVALARELSGGTDAGVGFDVASLAARLGDKAAAVGFRRFKKWRWETQAEPDSKGRQAFREVSTDSLFAFVVRGASPQSALTLVEVGPIAPIEDAARAWRAAVGVGRKRGASAVDPAVDPTRERGERLRQLVFDPLIPALGDAERVVVSLDDVLHLVPLDALPLSTAAANDSTNRLVGDRWRIETRATLAELLLDSPPPTGAALVALGGASFNVPAAPLSPAELASIEGRGGEKMLARVEEAEQPESSRPDEGPALLRGTAWERGFSPLTHSGPEASGIGALYEEIYEGERPVLVLEKRRASREAIEEVAPRARFLHVATHGWFAPESIRSWSDPDPIDARSGLGARSSGLEQVRGMSPMLLCGLALAGANLSADAAGRTPGLVTAEELSTLDLSNCELVVLSACDTNVGERRAGQGVASLQKALQMAGARSVITSLWKVPDEATKELMLDFYRRLWVEKKPKHRALWEAKAKLRDAKDERGRPLYGPRDWAGWVLTGEPD